MKVLLLGLGNPLLTDDAVGVRLARALASHLVEYADVDVIEECAAAGLDLIDVFSGYDRAIVLDSIRTVGGVAGRWHGFEADALQDTVHLTTVHDANFATALELGRRLGIPLPASRNIHVFAVEILDDLTFSERMTPALERAFPACATGILARVRALLDGEGGAPRDRPEPSPGPAGRANLPVFPGRGGCHHACQSARRDPARHRPARWRPAAGSASMRPGP